MPGLVLTKKQVEILDRFTVPGKQRVFENAPAYKAKKMMALQDRLQNVEPEDWRDSPVSSWADYFKVQPDVLRLRVKEGHVLTGASGRSYEVAFGVLTLSLVGVPVHVALMFWPDVHRPRTVHVLRRDGEEHAYSKTAQAKAVIDQMIEGGEWENKDIEVVNLPTNKSGTLLPL